MTNTFKRLTGFTVLPFLFLSPAMATEQEEVADMSDPTAVYTSVGLGYGNKGYNAKIGLQLPDAGDGSAHMISLEVKEGGDTFRGRYFKVDTTSGFASSLDASYDQLTGTAHVSAGALQTIPLTERLVIYPGLYLGGMIGDQENLRGQTTGVDLLAITATAQLYSKFQITEQMWLNLNPAYTTSLYGIESNKFDVEVAVGYQFTPVFNTRIFHNNNVGVGNYDEVNYESVTRIEFNYAF